MPVPSARWRAGRDAWLPTDAERAFVRSLMTTAVVDPKQMANWIRSPKQAMKGRPIDFEHVRREA